MRGDTYQVGRQVCIPPRATPGIAVLGGPLSSRAPRLPPSLLRAPPRDALLSIDAHKGSPTGGSLHVSLTRARESIGPHGYGVRRVARARAQRGGTDSPPMQLQGRGFSVYSQALRPTAAGDLNEGLRHVHRVHREEGRTRIINHRECLPGKDN